ncbi:MAG: ribonuclease HII [Gemmatimonas sp.]|nr:ribonuclease HII [Gemmatimonas sp.]
MARARKRATAKRGGRRITKRLRDRLLYYERGHWSRGVEAVAGVDEVGRGPLAGPVVAAAVILPPECMIRGADDSKKLTAIQREELAEVIAQQALCVRIGAASAIEIDRINILRATGLAMQRAVAKLHPAAQHILVDGLPMVELGLERQTAIVDGDENVHSIACASIIAKVCRDRLMCRLAVRYPEYGWEHNKGYATADHREAILRYGPTPHHRRSFQNVDQLALELEIP